MRIPACKRGGGTKVQRCDIALRASLRVGRGQRGTFTAERFLKHRFGVLCRPISPPFSLPCGLSGFPTASPKPFSSSLLPPSLASGRRMAVFMCRGTAHCGAPALFVRAAA